MRFLLGALPYNRHVQNIALALYEADSLGAYYTGGVDHYSSAFVRAARERLADAIPALDRQLRRRRISTIPEGLVFSDWRWDAPRTFVDHLRISESLKDWVWERGEYYFDRKLGGLLRGPRFDAFFGIEFGCLDTLRTSKAVAKKSVVAFLSPHHSYRSKWVDAEYADFPELMTPYARRLLKLAQARDERKDQEARTADIIHTASTVTANSLIAAGIPADKIIIVPLASPPIRESVAPALLLPRMRFLYSGPVSVRKGAHYLLRAWQRLNASKSVELHFFGSQQLPARCYMDCGENVVFHGSVPQSELFAAYDQSSVLVFPTLCDGFGMVVAEALAHGLPVITTRNAGAADLIQDGKNGFVVPPRDGIALAARMQWCIDHPDELREMRHHAVETAQLWTWTDFRQSLREQLGAKLN